MVSEVDIMYTDSAIDTSEGMVYDNENFTNAGISNNVVLGIAIGCGIIAGVVLGIILGRKSARK